MDAHAYKQKITFKNQASFRISQDSLINDEDKTDCFYNGIIVNFKLPGPARRPEKHHAPSFP